MGSRAEGFLSDAIFSKIYSSYNCVHQMYNTVDYTTRQGLRLDK